MDFMKISTRSVKQGVTEIFPKFILKKSSDLMIRGGDFYAVWREDLGLWSTEEQDVIDMVDQELYKFTEERRKTATDSLVTKYMWDSDSGSIDSWHKYCQKRMRDNFHPLDEKIIFGDTETTKTDYASKKLSYPLRECDISGYEKLISTLYTPEERHKIEWAIGSIIEGDSKYIQKFLVLYGSAGTGKSTILNIIQRLFEGYYSVFDAKALGSSSNSFALEAFKSNPMVAIQHDGDLSRIEDNTRLNSLVSHELMTVNEKFKSTYANKFNAFLFMGTNKPVKITDSKSGLLRRLIDVMPSGKKLDQKDYNDCINKIPFELPGIAYHCHQVYLKNKDAYDNYVPTLMMGATNDFYNFVVDSFSVFKKNDGTTLKTAWEMYKTYCDETKVTLCNNLPIAHISSGLPLKEGGKKVINIEGFKNEQHLRTMIKKNLNKEIHPSTRCSIDFINKLLDDAYDSGQHYDVSDMKNAVYAFATQSTNQAPYCIKAVNKMPFKSEDAAPPVGSGDDSPLIFFDCEVFPNLFLINWKVQGEKTPIVRMINPTPQQVEELIRFKLVGFNCRRYDNHMLYACMMGYTPLEIYNLSQKIINSSKGESRKYLFGEAYNISYTDIYDFASAGNKKSLKKLEIEMGIHHQELGLPWDKPVPEELWQKVAEYCDNDVLATEAAWNYLQSDWLAREILADLAGLTVNDTTNTLTTKFIFGNNKNPQNEFNYRNLAEPVFEMDEETHDFLEEACPEMMSQTHGEAGSLLPYFPGYKYENGVSTYRGEEVGEGGYVYAEPGMYGNVALLDIASMHPHSTIAECLFGVRYTKAYRDIVEGRVSIKHEAWDEVDKMLDGKLKPYIQRVKDGELTSKDLANALKTAINSVYGLTSATFSNPFHDVRNKDNIVAKRGALFMVDLKHEVQKRGFTVAHIKTDSIKIPDATPEIIKFVMDFGKKYGYTFEHEATYDRMCLVNNAVYIAKYKDPEGCEALYGYAPGDNRKHKNDPWTATGKQFAVPYVFKTCFSKEPTTINDMRETFSVKSALYLDMNEKLPDVSEYEKRLEKLESDYKKGKISDTTFEPEAAVLQEQINDGHNRQFVGKVGEFCPIKPGCGGGLLVREQNGKFYAATGTTGYRWLESEQFLKKADEDVEVIDPETGEKKKIAGAEIINGNNDDIIDRSYYDNLVNDAIEAISKYGDYEWFVSDDPYIAKEKPLPDFMNIPDGYEEEIPFA